MHTCMSYNQPNSSLVPLFGFSTLLSTLTLEFPFSEPALLLLESVRRTRLLGFLSAGSLSESILWYCTFFKSFFEPVRLISGLTYLLEAGTFVLAFLGSAMGETGGQEFKFKCNALDSILAPFSTNPNSVKPLSKRLFMLPPRSPLVFSTFWSSESASVMSWCTSW